VDVPTPSEAQYNYNYDVVTNVQNMVIVIGLGVLWLKSKRAWRVVYANLFGGAAMYMLSSLVINVAISMHKYSTGGPYDLPLISSFLWFGLAGVVAYLNRAELDSFPRQWLGQRRKATGKHVVRQACYGCGYIVARIRDFHAALRARCSGSA